jgi:hypothetical protein
VHAAEARKLDRLVFGPESTVGVTDAASSSDDRPAAPRV